jgi:hypothetical protein
MTPSLRGWEAFPTPGALTHTRITWAFSPPAPQVPGVTPGSPLCPWCFRHPLWRGARQLVSSSHPFLKQKFMFSSHHSLPWRHGFFLFFSLFPTYDWPPHVQSSESLKGCQGTPTTLQCGKVSAFRLLLFYLCV